MTTYPAPYYHLDHRLPGTSITLPCLMFKSGPIYFICFARFTTLCDLLGKPTHHFKLIGRSTEDCTFMQPLISSENILALPEYFLALLHCHNAHENYCLIYIKPLSYQDEAVNGFYRHNVILTKFISCLPVRHLFQLLLYQLNT